MSSVTVGIEDVDVVRNIAEPDALPHPVQADEIGSLTRRLICTVRENLLICAGFSRKTNDEGWALLAVSDFSEDVGVAHQANSGCFLVCWVFLDL